jgi:anti-sigma-K factor RskA
MNIKYWHDHPETLRRLAAAYALGTLSGPARRRFGAVMRQRPDAAQAVAAWNRRWVPVAQQLTPQVPSEALWARIEARTFGADAVVQQTPPAASRAVPTAPSPLQRLARALQALLAPAPAFALAAGLMAGVLLPEQLAQLNRSPADPEAVTELPASYVGVLATAQGRTGLIVSSLRRGQVLDVKRVQAVNVPAGQTLFLWTLDAQGRAQPIGALNNAPFSRVALPRPAEDLFAQAVELGVTLEAPGSAPTVPSAAGFVYRGLCGKLWRLPPAAPVASSAAAAASAASR